MDVDVLISFVIATSALAIAPGPDVIYVLMQSITNGKSFGIATAVGLVTGCLVHTTLVAFGISAIIKASDSIFFGIKLLGAIYLIYLAYKVYKSDANLMLTDTLVPEKTGVQLFKQGFIMNVLNPKVSIFFLAFFPGFLFSNTLGTIQQFYILGFIFIGVSFIVFATIAILGGSISEYLKQHKGTGLVLKWMQIIVFIGIAMFILLSEK
ncbi:LysE family translocator [Formosa algae]|uniref:Threonine/homoserine/homoserine lactone efflux protein n=1 Tax=Formosa algae TaxID=225843 RepID=A0A9X0YMP1_9FLAO|nr:LysE family translocator [Formosa algae]MBP1841391.1 threonine/homoserine/homoserine lactone efflux protein [Formosa algae]MDQ0336687.1 threonine/homoserine/homoserine lactone efflux protein [Formosa algae]OEI81854.1 lysine transporter LysE [Formosa algae]PNW28597.1 lysine transporter LysE [Formosa algae]